MNSPCVSIILYILILLPIVLHIVYASSPSSSVTCSILTSAPLSTRPTVNFYIRICPSVSDPFLVYKYPPPLISIHHVFSDAQCTYISASKLTLNQIPFSIAYLSRELNNKTTAVPCAPEQTFNIPPRLERQSTSTDTIAVAVKVTVRRIFPSGRAFSTIGGENVTLILDDQFPSLFQTPRLHIFHPSGLVSISPILTINTTSNTSLKFQLPSVPLASDVSWRLYFTDVTSNSTVSAVDRTGGFRFRFVSPPSIVAVFPHFLHVNVDTLLILLSNLNSLNSSASSSTTPEIYLGEQRLPSFRILSSSPTHLAISIPRSNNPRSRPLALSLSVDGVRTRNPFILSLAPANMSIIRASFRFSSKSAPTSPAMLPLMSTCHDTDITTSPTVVHASGAHAYNFTIWNPDNTSFTTFSSGISPFAVVPLNTMDPRNTQRVSLIVVYEIPENKSQEKSLPVVLPVTSKPKNTVLGVSVTRATTTPIVALDVSVDAQIVQCRQRDVIRNMTFTYKWIVNDTVIASTAQSSTNKTTSGNDNDVVVTGFGARLLVAAILTPFRYSVIVTTSGPNSKTGIAHGYVERMPPPFSILLNGGVTNLTIPLSNMTNFRASSTRNTVTTIPIFAHIHGGTSLQRETALFDWRCIRRPSGDDCPKDIVLPFEKNISSFKVSMSSLTVGDVLQFSVTATISGIVIPSPPLRVRFINSVFDVSTSSSISVPQLSMFVFGAGTELRYKQPTTSKIEVECDARLFVWSNDGGPLPIGIDFRLIREGSVNTDTLRDTPSILGSRDTNATYWTPSAALNQNGINPLMLRLSVALIPAGVYALRARTEERVKVSWTLAVRACPRVTLYAPPVQRGTVDETLFHVAASAAVPDAAYVFSLVNTTSLTNRDGVVQVASVQTANGRDVVTSFVSPLIGEFVVRVDVYSAWGSKFVASAKSNVTIIVVNQTTINDNGNNSTSTNVTNLSSVPSFNISNNIERALAHQDQVRFLAALARGADTQQGFSSVWRVRTLEALVELASVPMTSTLTAAKIVDAFATLASNSIRDSEDNNETSILEMSAIVERVVSSSMSYATSGRLIHAALQRFYATASIVASEFNDSVEWENIRKSAVTTIGTTLATGLPCGEADSLEVWYNVTRHNQVANDVYRVAAECFHGQVGAIYPVPVLYQKCNSTGVTRTVGNLSFVMVYAQYNTSTMNSTMSPHIIYGPVTGTRFLQRIMENTGHVRMVHAPRTGECHRSQLVVPFNEIWSTWLTTPGEKQAVTVPELVPSSPQISDEEFLFCYKAGTLSAIDTTNHTRTSSTVSDFITNTDAGVVRLLVERMKSGEVQLSVNATVLQLCTSVKLTGRISVARRATVVTIVCVVSVFVLCLVLLLTKRYSRRRSFLLGRTHRHNNGIGVPIVPTWRALDSDDDTLVMTHSSDLIDDENIGWDGNTMQVRLGENGALAMDDSAAVLRVPKPIVRPTSGYGTNTPANIAAVGSGHDVPAGVQFAPSTGRMRGNDGDEADDERYSDAPSMSSLQEYVESSDESAQESEERASSFYLRDEFGRGIGDASAMR